MKKIYKICVVGAGRWGLNHVKALNRLKSLGGVVDKDKTVTDQIASNFPMCKTFSSLKDAFDYDFDGYIVSSPPNTHFEISKKLLSMKKPLLVEKPIALV